MTTSTSSAARPYRGSAAMTILALLSEKGGAGKSLAAEGLLAVGAARGLRALAVDLDGRATLTRTLTNVPLLPRSTPRSGTCSTRLRRTCPSSARSSGRSATVNGTSTSYRRGGP